MCHSIIFMRKETEKMTMRQWQGESVSERAADMRDSYTRRAVSASDTVVILDDSPSRYCASLKVAHISENGWIDFFSGFVNHSAQDDTSKHVSLTPSEVETLIAAYTAWKRKAEVAEFYRKARHELRWNYFPNAIERYA
jgi:hypothetical protein